MYGSGLLVSRASTAFLVLILFISSPALAGPKDTGTPSHGPGPGDTGIGLTGCTTPVPVPEGEPDDYMDRSGAGSGARYGHETGASWVWAVRVAALGWLGWLGR